MSRSRLTSSAESRTGSTVSSVQHRTRPAALIPRTSRFLRVLSCQHDLRIDPRRHPHRRRLQPRVRLSQALQVRLSNLTRMQLQLGLFPRVHRTRSPSFPPLSWLPLTTAPGRDDGLGRQDARPRRLLPQRIQRRRRNHHGRSSLPPRSLPSFGGTNLAHRDPPRKPASRSVSLRANGRFDCCRGRRRRSW